MHTIHFKSEKIILDIILMEILLPWKILMMSYQCSLLMSSSNCLNLAHMETHSWIYIMHSTQLHSSGGVGVIKYLLVNILFVYCISRKKGIQIHREYQNTTITAKPKQSRVTRYWESPTKNTIDYIIFITSWLNQKEIYNTMINLLYH